MRNSSLVTVISAVLLFTGCATTRIVSEDPRADIYMNERWVGTGEAKVPSIGPPRTVDLEARRENQVIGRTRMRRSFRFKTLLWGMCSYYTGLFWGWYYPREVFIHSQHAYPGEEKGRSIWDDREESVWMQPLDASQHQR